MNNVYKIMMIVLALSGVQYLCCVREMQINFQRQVPGLKSQFKQIQGDKEALTTLLSTCESYYDRDPSVRGELANLILRIRAELALLQ